MKTKPGCFRQALIAQAKAIEASFQKSFHIYFSDTHTTIEPFLTEEVFKLSWRWNMHAGKVMALAIVIAASSFAPFGHISVASNLVKDAGSYDAGLNFPALPSSMSLFGDKISIQSEIELAEGLLLDSNLDIVDTFWKAVPTSEGFLEKINLSGGIFENEGIVTLVDSVTKPKYLFDSSTTSYYPKQNILLHKILKKSIFDFDLEIYEASTMKLLRGVEKKTSYSPNCRPITNDLAIVWGHNDYNLIDLKTGDICYPNCDPYEAVFDEDIIATNKVIFDIKSKKVVTDISTLNIKGDATIKGDTIVFMYNSPNTGLKWENPILTAVSKKGELLYKKEVVVPKLYNLLGTYNDLAICYNSINYDVGIKVLNTHSQNIVFELLVSVSDFPVNIKVNGSRLFFCNNAGARIISLDSLKIERVINFPLNPQFLVSKDKVCVVLPNIDENNNKKKVAYLLDQNFKPILSTKTILPYYSPFLEFDGDSILSLNIVAEGQIEGHVGMNVFYHRLGSSKPFRTVNLPRIISRFGKPYFYKDGNLFVVADYNAVDRFVLETGVKYEYRLENLDIAPQDMLYEMLLGYKNGKICLLFPGENGWLVCFDENMKYGDKPIVNKRGGFRNFLELKDDYLICSNYVYSFADEKEYDIPGTVVRCFEKQLYYAEKASLPDLYKLHIIELGSMKDTYTGIESIYPDVSLDVLDQDHLLANGFVLKTNGTKVQQCFGLCEKLQGNFFLKKRIRGTAGTVLETNPCPSFSVKRLTNTSSPSVSPSTPLSTSASPSASFDLTMTRDDGLADVLRGEAYIAAWGDDGKAPIFTKLNGERVKIGPLLPGMKQIITLKLPEGGGTGNVGGDVGSVFNGDGSKSEGKYFALIIESNGLLDTDKSELLEFDREGRPLYDGTPLSLDRQHAMVVSVWGR